MDPESAVARPLRSRLQFRDAALVFAVALSVRVLFLFSTQDHAWPHSVLYEGDAPVWVRWAQALDRGEPFEFDLPMRTPAIAFALHWLVPGILAAPFTLLKLVWCALSAATCALLYLVVRRSLSERAAWIAAGLATFSFGSYELATSLNGEAPYSLLLVLLAGATVQWIRSPRLSLALAIGVLHGIALLVRAEHALVLAAFLVLGLLAARPRRPVAGSAAILLAAIAVCLPWSVRSHAATVRFNTEDLRPVDFAHARPPWTPAAQEFLRALPAFAREGNFNFVQYLARESGREQVDRPDLERFFESRFAYVPEPLPEWTLVSTKGPLDCALANHRASNGGFSRAALYDGTDAAPEFAFGRPSHLKLYNHGYRVAWSWIRADFGAWTGLVGKKLERFAAGATLGWSACDAPYGRELRRWPVDLATPLRAHPAWQWGILVVLLAGIPVVARTNLGALCLIVLGAKLAITVVYYGYARQAASILPVLFVFMAAAIDWGLAKARCPARAAAWGGVALALGLLACDVVRALGANQFDVRPLDMSTYVSAPALGPAAFECVGELEIRPR